jgi:hypothetical protein
MRKPRWKAFEMDDMITVAARTLKEARQWYCKECGIDEEDIFPWEVDMKSQYMEYPISEIPSNRKRRATCNGEGGPCIDIPLKKALKYQLRLHHYKEPFILCVCP